MTLSYACGEMVLACFSYIYQIFEDIYNPGLKYQEFVVFLDQSDHSIRKRSKNWAYLSINQPVPHTPLSWVETA